MEFNGEFENRFADSYMRNHKAVTVKNLRCFPRCSPEHKDNGYCGNEVVAHWRTQARQATGEYETYSEFQEADAPSRYDVHQIVPESELYAVPTLMRGEVVEADVNNGSIHFSRESKGWHYGWMAGRGNGSHALHEMRVFLFERIDRDNFVCRLLLRSTPFQVTSRKRIRPKKNSSASGGAASVDSDANKQRKRARKENEGSVVETPIKGLSSGTKMKKPATPSSADSIMMAPSSTTVDASFLPAIPPPNLHHHLGQMNEGMIETAALPTSSMSTLHQTQHMQQPAPHQQQMQHQQLHREQQPLAPPQFSHPAMPASKMDKAPAVPPFSRPRQPPAFLMASNSSGSLNSGGGGSISSGNSMRSEGSAMSGASLSGGGLSSSDARSEVSSAHSSHLPPPPTTHRHHQQRQSQQPFIQANPQSSQYAQTQQAGSAQPSSQHQNSRDQPFASTTTNTSNTASTASSTAANRSLTGVNWPFFSSTPPIYQHPAGTPPIYQHSISTTPPMFNFSHLFGGDQTTSSLFANMYQGQGAPIDDVLDLLMQPTPPNTFAALQMYRQAHQQQAYLQREKDEKEKQARGSVGTT
jgi:hypothetical protein